MKSSILVLALGLSFGLAASLPAAATPYHQEEYPAPYSSLRGLIDRTQNDLRAASELEHGSEKQHKRYRDAQEHLSNFDRHLVKGKFDKGELNHSIDAIKDILDHNTLQPSTRDSLMRDGSDLRVARDRTW